MSAVFDTIAAHYGQSPRYGSIRIPCPAHGGRDANADVFLNDDGEVRAVCYSHGCEPYDILVQLEHTLGIDRINPSATSRLWRQAEAVGSTQPFHDARDARRDACAAWDGLVAAVAADMGMATPFPSEPPSDRPFRDSAGHDGTYRPALRTDNLPEWAAQRLDAAREAAHG